VIGCLEAEAALLGCLLQTQSALLTSGFLKQIEGADFTSPQHRAVLEAMHQLEAARQPIDPVTVLGQMRRTGLEQSMTADRSAGVFLADLFAAPPSVGSVGHYLLVVLEHRIRRAVEATGVRLQQVAGSDGIDSARDVVRTDCAELARLFGRLAYREDVERQDAAS